MARGRSSHESFSQRRRAKFPLMLLRVLAILLLTGPLALPATAQTHAPTAREAMRLTFAPIVKRVAPAVVNVYSRRVVTARSPLFDDPFFRRFFGEDSPFGLSRERVQNS